MTVGEQMELESTYEGDITDGRRSCHNVHTFSTFTIVLSVAAIICALLATFFITHNIYACPQQCDNCTHFLSELSFINDQMEDENLKIFTRNASQLEQSHRLPRSIVPLTYDIKIIPFINPAKNFTFNGDITILMVAKEPTKNITIHALDLLIKRENVQVRWMKNARGTMEIMKITDQYSDVDKQFYVIKLAVTMQVGETYEVRIKYNGVLSEHMVGFYRSSYKFKDQIRWVAATQFQPTDARRAFPCFDEPHLKAKFMVSIARTRNMTTLSNMPKSSSNIAVAGQSAYVWDMYEDTVPMSTYLVCFTVTDFANLTDGKFSVWARMDVIQSSAFALDLGPKLLKFFEQYFDIPYPLMKLDMIAIPDFQAGAMENWGLITFRESAMLYEMGVSPNVYQHRVAIVIAHEISHQWFGNLVTPSWWSDLWLNEGFASYMEYFGVEGVRPEWKSMEMFVVSELQAALVLDALSSSHQIFVHVVYPDEINEIFDRITYAKGASIIRMMDHFLTPEIFKMGLHHYLKKSAYRSADQNVLWNQLTETARNEGIFDNRTSVGEIMNSWTMQSGFPLVTVIRDYEKQTMNLKQEKYFSASLLLRNRTNPLNSSLWFIPITFTTARSTNFKNTRPSYWMRNEVGINISSVDAASTDWIVVNVQQTGYYRVNYDNRNWDLISKYLRKAELYKNIAPSNRAQLIDDALNLAKSGYIDYRIAMNVTKYLIHEVDYVPWKSAIDTLSFIDNMMTTEAEYYKFKKYMLNILENIYKIVGFEEPIDSDIVESFKRIEILTVSCHLGHIDCIMRCQQLYKRWMLETSNPDANNPFENLSIILLRPYSNENTLKFCRISPNLRPVVYCMAIKYGGHAEWDFAWNRYKNSSVSSEEEILLSAMGCTRETWILARYLEMSLTESFGIRRQDTLRVFTAVSDNVIGHPLVFNFIRSNFMKIKEFMGSSMTNLHVLIKYCIRITKEYEMKEFKKFIVENKLQSVRTIYQTLESGTVNVAWMQRNYNIVVEWLEHAIEEHSSTSLL